MLNCPTNVGTVELPVNCICKVSPPVGPAVTVTPAAIKDCVNDYPLET